MLERRASHATRFTLNGMRVRYGGGEGYALKSFYSDSGAVADPDSQRPFIPLSLEALSIKLINGRLKHLVCCLEHSTNCRFPRTRF